MMKSFRNGLLGVGLFFIWHGLNAQTGSAGCTGTTVLVPEHSQVISEPRPLLVWQTATQQRSHIVLEARIPERELVQRIDTEAMGNSIKVPQELTNYRANVKVALSVPCVTAEKSSQTQTTNMRFYIDTGLACLSPTGFTQQAPGKLVWSKASAGDAVEIALFRVSDWKEVSRTRTALTTYEMAGAKDISLVAVARSVCGKALSAPAFVYY